SRSMRTEYQRDDVVCSLGGDTSCVLHASITSYRFESAKTASTRGAFTKIYSGPPSDEPELVQRASLGSNLPGPSLTIPFHSLPASAPLWCGSGGGAVMVSLQEELLDQGGAMRAATCLHVAALILSVALAAGCTQQRSNPAGVQPGTGGTGHT